KCSRSRKARISSGANVFTGVRQVSSKSLMVCLSIAPTSCSASMVSWMAARASLRYCLSIAIYLRILALINHRIQVLIRQRQNVLCCLLEGGLLFVVNVALLAFREAEDEESTALLAV